MIFGSNIRQHWEQPRELPSETAVDNSLELLISLTKGNPGSRFKLVGCSNQSATTNYSPLTKLMSFGLIVLGPPVEEEDWFLKLGIL